MNIKLVIIIFCGLFLRFAFFPNDISFIYDQARDAYAATEIAHLHPKIIGPPTVVPGIYHGVLTYYFLAPLYLLSHGDPSFPAAIFRLVNLLGIIAIYSLGKKLFSPSVGIISAYLFAISFEQTQFALFFGHPALAVLPILLFYYFLSQKRFPYAAFCLGLAVQFHFAQISLFSIFIFYLLLNHRLINFKTIFNILLAISISLSSFILSELKFGFRTTTALLHSSSGQTLSLSSPILVFQRYITDNFAPWPIFGIPFLLGLIFLPRHKTLLSLWLIGGLVPYLLDHSSLPIYYYTIGGSISLILIASYYLSRWPKVLTAILLSSITWFNLQNISKFNPSGVIPAITVQSGMLLSDQKHLIDQIYQISLSKPFGVNALTNPYNINTTWSYLLSTYGKNRYGYIPSWIGDTAAGYSNQLPIINNRSQTPKVLFTILEPSRGLDSRLQKEFISNENIFTSVISESRFGQINLQLRQTK